jgi:hypothetical protein
VRWSLSFDWTALFTHIALTSTYDQLRLALDLTFREVQRKSGSVCVPPLVVDPFVLQLYVRSSDV